MAAELVNRVAKSKLLTIKLEDFWPKAERSHFDLKDYLFMELILKEKDFRAALREHDWEQYRDKTLLVYCSADAIIPTWAFMLVAAAATGIASEVYMGTEEEYIRKHFSEVAANLDLEVYRDQRVVVKGCSDKPVPDSAYLDVTARLQPVTKSIMFGEPCSIVPVYKKAVVRRGATPKPEGQA
ncbi:MAG: DUF2480 family protein [Bacteroidota bacterium]